MAALNLLTIWPSKTSCALVNTASISSLTRAETIGAEKLDCAVTGVLYANRLIVDETSK